MGIELFFARASRGDSTRSSCVENQREIVSLVAKSSLKKKEDNNNSSRATVHPGERAVIHREFEFYHTHENISYGK